MNDSLYSNYERELNFIRGQAAEFARKHPSMARALLLGESGSQDPHVERLIEGFALIAGRIHQRLDDEYPELTTGLLNLLYPHYLAPLPSMGIVQFQLDGKKSQLPEGLSIPSQTELRSQPIEGQHCKYRTCYPTELWPIEVEEAGLRNPPFRAEWRPPAGTRSVLRLVLGSLKGQSLAKVRPERLRFYLGGDAEIALSLRELILNHATRVAMSPDGPRGVAEPVVRSATSCLAAVGFAPEEALLPDSGRSFPGYRLLTELFAFPPKFLFFDLMGLSGAFASASEGGVEVLIFLDAETRDLELVVDRDNFRLGCVPVINLFHRTTEPIRLDHSRYEYRVVPDVTQPDGMEVYRVEGVQGSDARTGEVRAYEPFYSFRRGSDRLEIQPCWYASRRPSLRPGDSGTEVYLSLVDPDFNPTKSSDSTLLVRALCTNRDRPIALVQAQGGAQFQVEGVAPPKVKCLVEPTPAHRPPLGRSTQWQIISHLSLNYLSIVNDGDRGVDALKEMLRIYRNYRPPGWSRRSLDTFVAQARGIQADKLIDGIIGVSSSRGTTLVQREMPGTFCRGLEITLDLDPDLVSDGEAFLLGGVLECFFGLYASINSYTRLAIRSGAKGTLKRWEPRAGMKPVL